MKNIKTKIYAVSLIIITLFTSFFGIWVSAEVLTYSDVMDDLQRDSMFDKTIFPELSYDEYTSLNCDEDPNNDVSFLSVIHVAESENGEFFVYTYQPMNNVSDITATSIQMYLGENTIDPVKYKLKCVSQEGVFKKYLVEGFTVSTDTYRFYNIVEIERPFDALLDEKISDETITNFKSHPVAQTWCCYYQNDRLVYEMATLNVVIITPTLTDYLYYPDGVTWGGLVGIDSGCNAHYIAFNVENYDIDKIYDASLEYYKRGFKTTHVQETGVLPFLGSLFGKEDEHTTTIYPTDSTYERVEIELSEEDVVSYTGNGLLAKTFFWNRIMTAEDFVKKYEDQGGVWSTVEKETLLSSQYVFAFAETDVSYKSFNTSNPDSVIDWSSSTTTVIEGIDVREVDILRLHFQSEGKTYNLGVVGDVTTGDNKPGGVADFESEDIWEKILMLVSIIALFCFLNFVWNPLSVFLKFILHGIGIFFEFIVYIVSFPFKIVSWIFKRR